MLVVALLSATAAAFAYTERLKLTPSPILGTRVDKVFSPVCDCPTATAAIRFRLRQSDTLDIEILDGSRRVVRHLVTSERYPRGRVAVRWDGRSDAGTLVAEGDYLPRVRLTRGRRTITLPNPIRLDTTAPTTRLVSLRPRVFSPDADGFADRVRARYSIDEPAIAILYVDGERHTVKRGRRTGGLFLWDGRIGGVPVAKGAHTLALAARDEAGNLGRRTPTRVVTARSVALGRDRVEVLEGGRFRILVSADAPTVEWKLGARTGTAPAGILRLRAPLQPGRFTLMVRVGDAAARAAVIVRERPA